MDYGLFNGKITAGEAGEEHFQLHGHQHWLTAGLRPIPTTVLSTTNSCVSHHPSVKLLKFADDTTMVGLITRGDESTYRGEIERLQSWCNVNNLELNALKTVEMVVDFRKDPVPHLPLMLGDTRVEVVESCRFLGMVISRDLKWELNISTLLRKAQQRMYFLRQLRKYRLSRTMMSRFYSAIVESILTHSIITWFPAAAAKDLTKLQRVIRSAERVIGRPLPSLTSLHDSRALKRARKIMADPSHPGHPGSLWEEGAAAQDQNRAT